MEYSNSHPPISRCGRLLLLLTCMLLMTSSHVEGFFIYMAMESLPGSQFWERLQLFVTDQGRLVKLVRGAHNEYLDKVPQSVIFKFTFCQFFGFSVCYAISQVPTEVAPVGIFFPVLIMVLVPLRLHVFPKIFSDHDLYYLDPREGATPPEDADTEGYCAGTIGEMAADDSDVSDEDVLAAAGLGSGFNANVKVVASRQALAEDAF